MKKHVQLSNLTSRFEQKPKLALGRVVKLFTFLLLSLPVWQAMASTSDDFRPFITTWVVDDFEGYDYINIPTTGDGYNYTVNWGDGTEDQGLTGDASHTYDSAGTYTVSITGDFPRIYFNGSVFADFYNSSKIASIEQWGDIEWKSMEGAFNGCYFMVIRANDAPDLSQVTNMSEMFDIKKKFDRDLGNWILNDEIDHFSISGVYGSTVYGEMSCATYSSTLIGWAKNNSSVNNISIEATGL